MTDVTSAQAKPIDPVLHTHDVTVDYSGKRALNETSLSFESGTVTALIGPSGCGKTTFLRSINLMNREIPGCVIGGKVVYHDINVNARGIDTLWLRKRVGMVFQQPNPFRKSIYENIAFALKSHGMTKRADLDERVEKSLRSAALWDEVKDKLRDSAYALSGGQQQRLCIARALAVRPEVLLMDEATSALDPISTAKIEDLVGELKSKYTVIMVTHNMLQALRVSDKTAFFLLGEMVEAGSTDDIFTNPADPRTADYVAGRFG